MNRDALIAHLDEYLDAQAGADYCPNGLQVEGSPDIRRVITGVSASRELFQRARDLEADAVLVHHGIFWKGDDPVLTQVQYRRVRELILGKLNLLAYHLPLDRHPEVGNNAVAVRSLGLVDIEPFGEYDDSTVGCKGRLPEPLKLPAALERIAETFGAEPLFLPSGASRGDREEVSSLAVVSGAAADLFRQAIVEGLDMFVTGEPREWVMNLARESSTHFVAAGHYATERLGVLALGDYLSRKFDLEVEFVDLPNPV